MRGAHTGEDRVLESIPFGVRLAGAWSWRLLLIGAVVAVLVYVVIQVRLIVVPVLIAVLLAALLVPFSNWLRRHRWPKWAAVTAAMLSALVAVGGLLTLGIWQIVRGSDELADQSVVAWDGFRDWLESGPLGLGQVQITDWAEQLFTSIRDDGNLLVSGALSVGTTLGHVLTGSLLALFATLFFVIDGAGIWRWLVSVFPRRARVAVDSAGRAGWNTLRNFVRVQILVATIDAVGIGVGAFALGLPLAVPIGILVFLGSFIPIVGAVATGALAVFVALVYNGLWSAVAMLAIVLLVQQLEGHVLQPLIMGTAVKVHPLGVVLAVATGSLIAGIPGALFAVPFVAVVNVMIADIAAGRWRGVSPPRAVRSPVWQTVPSRPRYLRTRRSE
ncbi:AI-2E family transporter [Agromyces sp. MMS17-SY077]|uniref:AI-2E family transporter n=2 Tax=Agromyces seonyuensis TaxID=2662446 RepID=A0A6I4NV54_9MICO|nr:AI-2E family transporter [Agromyces seonyuensis]